jgi:hypothetical protein
MEISIKKGLIYIMNSLWNSNDLDVGNGRMSVEELFHFGWIDIFATTHNHVLGAANN